MRRFFRGFLWYFYLVFYGVGCSFCGILYYLLMLRFSAGDVAKWAKREVRFEKKGEGAPDLMDERARKPAFCFVHCDSNIIFANVYIGIGSVGTL